MPEINRRALCVKHAPELAVGECDHCGNAFCDACRVEALTIPEIYCSEPCREAAEPDGFERFSAGFKAPFRTGIKLWADALPALLRHTLPVALVMAALLIFVYPDWVSEQGPAPSITLIIGLMLVAAYGIVLTSTVLSQNYTGLIRGNAHVWAAKRLLPWAATWALLALGTFLGYLALIIPGIIIALRLFWADEFALVHRAGPIASVKESWALTKGALGEIFVFQFIAGAFGWVIFMAGLIGLTALGVVTPLAGAIGVPLTFFVGSMVFFVGYGALHAPELAKFYGMRAAQLHGRAGA